MVREKEKGKNMKKNTCDILLCSGTGLMSRSIIRVNKLMGKKGDAAEISHVALFLESSYLRYVTEATMFNKWAGKRGVQINAFHKWLLHYAGKVFILHLALTNPVAFAVVRMILEPYLARKDYESGIPGLLELGLTFFPGVKLKQTPELHCSEVVVEVLQDLNLFHRDIQPNKMPPCEFWPGGRFEKHLMCGSSGLERIKPHG